MGLTLLNFLSNIYAWMLSHRHSRVVRKNTCTMNESHKYLEKKKKWKMTQDISYLFIIYNNKQEKG